MKVSKENNIAFIDGQNLHLGTTANNWKVDYLLQKERFKKILFPSKKFSSSLYKKLGSEYFDYLEDLKTYVAKNKKGS